MSPEQALDMVESLSKMFNTTVPQLRLDCSECFGNPNVLACYKVHENTICLRTDIPIEPRLVQHEFAHHLYRSYYGDQCSWWNTHCPSDLESEAFARWFEDVGEATGLRFRCQVCGNMSPWTVREDRGFRCDNCKAVYDVA